MMDQAQTVDELIQIESELSRLELNIEDCQGALNYWDERIQYSSVTIYVDEVKRAAQEDQPLGLQMQNAGQYLCCAALYRDLVDCAGDRWRRRADCRADPQTQKAEITEDVVLSLCFPEEEGSAGSFL